MVGQLRMYAVNEFNSGLATVTGRWLGRSGASALFDEVKSQTDISCALSFILSSNGYRLLARSLSLSFYLRWLRQWFNELIILKCCRLFGGVSHRKSGCCVCRNPKWGAINRWMPLKG